MIGATGHLQSVMDSALSSGQFEIVSIIDDFAPTTKEYFNTFVSGKIDLLPILYEQGIKKAFVSAGTIGGYGKRKEYYEIAKKIGFDFVNIIDPSAVVSHYSEIGNNIFIGKNAVVNAYATIEDMAIINTASIVEHADCIEQYAHIAPGSILCGAVHIEKAVHIGAGCHIKQDVRIGKESIVGMGSVVLTDLPANCIAFGNPCKIQKTYDNNKGK